MSDEDEIRRAAQGDRAAQAALVHRTMPQVFRLAYRMLADAAEAEDVTQETFLRAWKALPTWQPKAKFSTWACTVAVNLCRDRLRKKRPYAMAKLPERVDPGLRPDEALTQKQAVTAMTDQIAALPDRQREALTLCALEGMGNIEAAGVMDVSVEALESLLARARRTLRKAREERETTQEMMSKEVTR
ncbi:MAG: sigma-70 family RNA polymerase sigma factor [Pseudomonadota bacterium]